MKTLFPPYAHPSPQLALLTDREREVMALVNEQQEWNRRTRDLIAAARPCPIAVTDGFPSVMVPQWHRGTEWARDAARAFHDEVRGRVDAGVAVCPDERLRLMWIGRGLWFDLDFYQRFQRSHGAVFVWSMYMPFAGPQYIRELDGRDMHALASRICSTHSATSSTPHPGRPSGT